MDKLEHYLDQVCRSIGGPKALRQHLRQELREHLRDAVAEHKAAGVSEEEALARALEHFGKPEDVRSELEATHGYRLMPVVIDKAMQWKEMTMRAKWLWTTWTYIAVVVVVVLELLYIPFTRVMLLPKFQKIMQDTGADFNDPNVSWLHRLLVGTVWVCDHLAWWWVAVLAALWGLFEWRVRSENKTFMRLSALGTAAVGLMIVVVLITGSMLMLFMLHMPGSGLLAPSVAGEQITVIDRSVAAIEGALPKKDWEAMDRNAEQVYSALAKLQWTVRVLSSWHEPARLEDMPAQLNAARQYMYDLQRAIRERDAGRLESALQKFHKSYGPVRDWTTKLIKDREGTGP